MPGLIAMVERQTPASIAALISALLNRPHSEGVLATVPVPTLLARGTADLWSPLEPREPMRRLLLDARLEAIEETGPMALVEQPGSGRPGIGPLAWHLVGSLVCRTDEFMNPAKSGGYGDGSGTSAPPTG